MNKKEAKEAGLLNYGIMCDDVRKVIKERAEFMSKFWSYYPEFNEDEDFVSLAKHFTTLLNSLWALEKAGKLALDNHKKL